MEASTERNPPPFSDPMDQEVNSNKLEEESDDEGEDIFTGNVSVHVQVFYRMWRKCCHSSNFLSDTLFSLS